MWLTAFVIYSTSVVTWGKKNKNNIENKNIAYKSEE
jgi:hypothetical protein